MRGVAHRFQDGSGLLLALCLVITGSIAMPATGQAQPLLAGGILRASARGGRPPQALPAAEA
jgi:hypothetical protein